MSRRRETVFILMFGLAVLLCGACASASAQMGPCAEDTAKLCKDIRPGEGRLVKCLRAHDAELSEACKASVQRDSAVSAKMQPNPGQPKPVQAQPAQPAPVQATPSPCEEDAKKFCKDVQPGQGRVATCLSQHLEEVSPGCKASFGRHLFGAEMPAAKGAASGTVATPPPAPGTPH